MTVAHSLLRLVLILIILMHQHRSPRLNQRTTLIPHRNLLETQRDHDNVSPSELNPPEATP